MELFLQLMDEVLEVLNFFICFGKLVFEEEVLLQDLVAVVILMHLKDYINVYTINQIMTILSISIIFI